MSAVEGRGKVVTVIKLKMSNEIVRNGEGKCGKSKLDVRNIGIGKKTLCNYEEED